MRGVIYIVDDQSVAEMCGLIVEQFFPEVLEPRLFTSASASLAAFRRASRKPEIVCAALMNGSGLELAYQMKSVDPALRLLLTSGCTANTVNEALAHADVLPDAVLLKPFALESWIAVIHGLVSAVPVPLGESSSGVWPFGGERNTRSIQRPARPGG